MVSAKANGLSQGQWSQLRPTVSAGRLSAQTDGLSWQTVNQDQRSQLADCQPRPTFSAGRLSTKTDGLSWQTVSQDQRSQLADSHVRVPEPVPQLGEEEEETGTGRLGTKTIYKTAARQHD
ncbi:hypothetical protein PCANC_15222 [Puccinia coronata f. sp. avenae]|uniref:Uncharacterized protein n=1 Tax=Puccinia coronata f. sp. avenae TaxID=200324 RepID=A0A2N5VNL5_9BASI|nr:hypothetical protein PCANC_15222 [Puccinia coronata f. sp. avenae]